jgi:hypothetical protein
MRDRKLISLLLVLIAGAFACQSAPPPTNASTNAPLPTASAAAATTNPANPCWVHIWEDENYGDNNDIIFGPGRWNNMRNLPGANKNDWGDEIDSLKVGPTATVTVWEDENFGDNSQTYGPGTEKTNLRGNPDMGDQIDSMEIKCR